MAKFELYDELYNILSKHNITNYDDYFTFVLMNYATDLSDKNSFYVSPKFFMRWKYIKAYHESFTKDLLARHQNTIFFSSLRNIINYCNKKNLTIRNFIDVFCDTEFKVFGEILKNKISIFLILALTDYTTVMSLPDYMTKELELKFNTKIKTLKEISSKIIETRFNSKTNFMHIINKEIKGETV